jgi:2-dehydro-3-deoxy-D-arabinonate dehydratase
MKLCRYRNNLGETRIGCVVEPEVLADLSTAGVQSISSLLERNVPPDELRELCAPPLPRVHIKDVALCCPAEQQEVWAAGVTYLRSKTARMQESDFSANAYDRVYEARRPELFFKSLGDKAVGPGSAVGIRRDSHWSVPEPELALVLNSRGKIVGFTAGNDMSARDIEGENLLYLPQAKIYAHSCALGPYIVIGVDETEARTWTIELTISRNGSAVFSGKTAVDRMKRPFDDLVSHLFTSQSFPKGAILLTGTGIVPPDPFTLAEGDVVDIGISGVGSLKNHVSFV